MAKMTHYRWTICMMMFLALTINYLDRQVLSLTWDEFIKPEFHWNEMHYGVVTATFSIVYALGMLFAGRIIDWLGTKKGYLWSIGIWSAGACLHAFCGILTESVVGVEDKAHLIAATGDLAVLVSTVSMYFFLAARCVLAIGESGYFPVAVKVTAEYFPKRDRAFATSVFNAGASIGALVAPLSIPLLAKYWGWEFAFVAIGVLGFVWMGFWVFMYAPPAQSRFVNQAELDYIEQDKQLEAGVTPYTSSFDLAESCVFAKQSLGPFHCGLFSEAPLIPKLRGQFAEFLNNHSPVGLRILIPSTCVGLRYGHLSNTPDFSRHSRLLLPYYYFGPLRPGQPSPGLELMNVSSGLTLSVVTEYQPYVHRLRLSA